MKLNTNNEAIEISGGNEASSFSIAMNGKAFRVLSDTLYQNKIGSIVREICCNAYDAHVSAGNVGVPFVVHLPDNFEPWFSVQDFGVGLSADDIKNVFTVYFQSTKDQSNDSIGAFGLGAKTPFSYTDQFTVTSIKNGIKSIYSAYITEKGIPDIRLMFSENTSQGNGVEIKMSVKSEDFGKFATELTEQLRFFTVKPIVKNSRNFEFEKQDDVLFENKHVRIHLQQVWQSSIWIVQGIVGYKLNYDNLRGKISQEATHVIESLINMKKNTIIKFDIGQIGVTASREGIEYTKDTIAHIEAKAEQIALDLAEELKGEVQAIDNDWDKVVHLQTKNIFGGVRTLKSLLDPDIKIDTWGNVVFDLDDIIMKEDPVTKRKHRIVEIRTGSRGSSLRGTLMTGARPDAVTYFIVRDKVSFMNTRIRKFLDKNTSAYVTVFFANEGYLDVNFKNKLQAALGGCKRVLMMSEIELDKAEKIVYKRKSTTAEWYNHTGRVESSSFTREFTYVEDIDEPKVYVEFINRSYDDSDDINLVAKYQQLKNVVGDSIDIPDLIAVRKTQIDKVKKNKNLTPLKEFMKDVLDKVENVATIKNEWKKWRMLCSINHHVNGEILRNLDAFKQEAPHSSYTKHVAFLHNIKRQLEDVKTDKLQAAQNLFGWQYDEKRSEVFTNSLQKVLDKLPVVRAYSSSYGVGHYVKIQDIVQYVKYIPH